MRLRDLFFRNIKSSYLRAHRKRCALVCLTYHSFSAANRRNRRNRTYLRVFFLLLRATTIAENASTQRQ